MKIMSFNILCYGNEEHYWEDRAPYVVSVIKKENPDSFGVQEATPDWMKYLNENLDEYDFVGVGRDDGADEGEYSAVFYKKDLFNLSESNTYWLSETPDKVSKGWDGACRRVCTYALLERKCDGKKYAHINTHLDHIGPIARSEGIKQIIETAVKYNDYPTVVTGDFNLDEGCDLYKNIISSGVLHDTKFCADDTMNSITFNDFDRGHPGIIDYIFINDKFKALKYRVVTDKIDGKFVSDHYPVTAELE